MAQPTVHERNTFEPLADAYARYRRDYPAEFYVELRRRIGKAGAAALDVGCGTGMVAKRLAEFCGIVVGVDKEPEMVALAHREEIPHAEFLVAAAESLPFADHAFDVVTVGQAFHWFDGPRALAEFRRVCRPGGLIAIFQKRKNNSRQLLEDFVWRELAARGVAPAPEPKRPFDADFFQGQGFSSVETAIFPFEERYTPEDYLGFLTSHSTYNLVAVEKRESYRGRLHEEVHSRLENGEFVTNGTVEAYFLRNGHTS